MRQTSEENRIKHSPCQCRRMGKRCTHDGSACPNPATIIKCVKFERRKVYSPQTIMEGARIELCRGCAIRAAQNKRWLREGRV